MIPIFYTWQIIPAAFFLDLVFGDPRFLPHPIRWMGRAITLLEMPFRRMPLNAVVSGGLFSIFLIAGTWGLTFILLAAAEFIHPALGSCIEVVFIYYAVSARSLESSAMDVYRPLMQNRLSDAKEKVSLIVGRDVDKLSQEGVMRATVETVAENLVDGVISPLFFAAIGGAPLAMAYKMINTLDSMTGYKNERYHEFGKVAARIDDMANFIPARLCIPVISFASQILAGRGSIAFKTAVKEGKNHTSPNAGYPEAAFAGAFGIRLGGPNYYKGDLVSKPYIGNNLRKVRIKDIKKACDLMILSSILWVAILCVIMVLFSMAL
ncbi:MAG: cobalamin biosynthesis protein CobD [Desulfobacteraceae bacterium 4484_190.3]|nr:MAG: cobalamin biosynthesis protein CobD [Desulfobacteraceae bacterium 4484_190.3]